MPLAVDRAATLPGDDDEGLARPPEAEGAKTFTRSITEARAELNSASLSAPLKEDAPPSEEAQAGRVLADRYRLIEPLGEGAHGDVWVADDLVLLEPLALKWMRSSSGSSLPRIRREITTLRMLRIPGVVRLFDDGIEDGRPFLVMERVKGRPFPGDAEPCPGLPARFSWEALAETTLALLEVLSCVHAAGVVHRDLKPDNILVDAAGRPTVLDFGISLLHDPDRQGRTGSGSIVGTPRYLAPEQILGRGVDGRADLYAVGVMLFEALTGKPPHEASDVPSLLRARLMQPAPPVRELVPELPALVGEVVDRLLSTRAEGRFRSAREVLSALGGDARAARTGPALHFWSATLQGGEDGPLDEAALRPLFAGPDRLFHLREDAARLLWERTEGKPPSIEAELTVWTRLGLARWDDAVLVVDRDALSRLRATLPHAAPAPSRRALLEDDAHFNELSGRRAGEHLAIAASLEPGEDGKLFHLLAADRLCEGAQEAVELSRRRAREGDLGGATAALSEGLRAARGQGGSEWAREWEARILAEWTKVALADRTPFALDQALYEISRARDRRPDVERLDTLLRSTLSASGAGALYALDSVDGIPPFKDPELERRRHWARVAAAAGARSSSALLEEVLEDVAAWAARSGDPLSLLSLAEGRARLCYGQGRFEEAAALHMEAAEREPWLTGRIAATLNAASSLLEAFRHREAAERAAEARDLAARCRHAYQEGRAEWLLRAAMYRMGEAGAPDLELVDAAARVGVPDLEALVCLNEAAVAFREGSLAIAAELSGRAAQVWKALNRPGGPLLSRALALACGAPAGAGEVEALSNKAVACRIPGIGIQVLGLLGRASPTACVRWQEATPGLAEMIPREHWRQRMDVLSVEEALAGAVGGAGQGSPQPSE